MPAGYSKERYAYESASRYHARVKLLKTRAMRDRLWETQRGLCFYCGKAMTRSTFNDRPTDATLDQKKPRAEGGRTRLMNCALACKQCNQSKGSLSVVEFQIVRVLHGLYWSSRLKSIEDWL